MLLTTMNDISGKEMKTPGLVKESTIQTINIAHDIGMGLKTLLGCEK